MSVAENPEQGERGSAEPSDRLLYWVIGAVLLALLVGGIAIFRHESHSRKASAKTRQLTAALRAEGLDVPIGTETITRVLGSDGGPVCDDPGSALAKGILLGQLSNGASSVGQRPVIVGRQVVQGELIVLKVYCPDQVPKFRDLVAGLKFDNTIKD